jgi:hypothetical protein
MKPNKEKSVQRKQEIIKKTTPRPDKGQDSRKVHDTKGKNVHGRTYR